MNERKKRGEETRDSKNEEEMMTWTLGYKEGKKGEWIGGIK